MTSKRRLATSSCELLGDLDRLRREFELVGYREPDHRDHPVDWSRQHVRRAMLGEDEVGWREPVCA